MTESLFSSNNTIGYCTLIETTRSRLFSHGCDVSADYLSDDNLWFNVSVPTAASGTYEELRRIVGAHNGGTQWANISATPILIEVLKSENVASLEMQKQASLVHVLANRFLRAYEHT